MSTIKHIYLIGNKPKDLYTGTDYSDLVDDKDSIVMRVNRMKSIETGLTGSKTDLLFCDKFAFSWDKEFVSHVINTNKNMKLIIPFHSITDFASESNFDYDFNNDKSDKYPGIQIRVIGHNDTEYYVDYIKDSMPAIKMTFPNYYPTNVSYALQYLLNTYIYNNTDTDIKYDLTLIGIDVHDRIHTYNAPALRPIVHKAFVPYEDKWFNQLEKDNIIKVLD